MHRVLGGPHTDRAVGMWYSLLCLACWARCGSVRCDKWRTRIGKPVRDTPEACRGRKRKSKEGERQAGLASRFGLNRKELELDFNFASQFRRAVAQ